MVSFQKKNSLFRFGTKREKMIFFRSTFKRFYKMGTRLGLFKTKKQNVILVEQVQYSFLKFTIPRKLIEMCISVDK
jgi:hypothetical protein